jgi:hypothetical protein
MRLAVTLAIVLLLGGSTALAQERQLGLKIGPSFSIQAFEPVETADYERRVSADGGGFAVLPMTRHLAVQFEALFTSRGAKLYDPELDLTGTILLQYFELPALLRFPAPASERTAFHVFGGVYPALRISAERQVSTFAGSIRAGEKTDIGEEIERFEFGLIAGAGVDIGRRVVIDGRYSHGITALNTDKSDGFRIRNRAISVMAGFRF